MESLSRTYLPTYDAILHAITINKLTHFYCFELRTLLGEKFNYSHVYKVLVYMRKKELIELNNNTYQYNVLHANNQQKQLVIVDSNIEELKQMLIETNYKLDMLLEVAVIPSKILATRLNTLNNHN